VKTGHFTHDARHVYVDLDTMRSFARSASDSSEICVRAAPGQDVKALAAAIRHKLRRLPAVGVADWEEQNAHILGPVRNQRTILAVILMFFVIVACFNVFATLTILVTDKVRDIGLLTALGSTAPGVSRVFVTCGLIISGIGSAFGALTGVFVARHINLVNDAIDRLTGVRIFRASIYTFDVIPVHIDPWFVAGVAGFTVAFAVACALFPSFRAARMDPVQALRYE
jgi:lipoprotein-releasing system permease protein